MEISDRQKQEFVMRLITARTRLLCSHGFFGLLVMHATFALDETISTAATDGDRIIFSPKFMSSLTGSELDFVLMHEIMHIALRHVDRQGERDHELFNIACDIVVNSNILRDNGGDLKKISIEGIGVLMHVAPDGKEGYEYTAEEVYEMLLSTAKRIRLRGGKVVGQKPFDDHSMWRDGVAPDDASAAAAVWAQRIANAAEAITVRKGMGGVGDVPLFAKRILKELRGGQVDWRTVLNDFVQEEIVDYSFSPPDRRFDGPFFLPDFNGVEYIPGNLLFMIDTSGSMSDDMVASVFSEVKSAVDQFDGKINGMLGFFDAAVVPPQPFSDVTDLKKISPIGGGGTNFHAVFDYVDKYMSDDPPKSIIILTDGEAKYPKKSAAHDVPVLWIICDGKKDAPWGRTVHIKS